MQLLSMAYSTYTSVTAFILTILLILTEMIIDIMK